jgi:hypothetical protein
MVIKDSESEREIQCISPEGPPINAPEPSPNSHGHNHDDGDAKLAIIGPWLIGWQGEGADEELARVLEDDDEDEGKRIGRMQRRRRMVGIEVEERLISQIPTTKVIVKSIFTCAHDTNPFFECRIRRHGGNGGSQIPPDVYTPDEDALAEVRHHDPDDSTSYTVPISIDAALKTLAAFLRAARRRYRSIPLSPPALRSHRISSSSVRKGSVL